MSRMRQALMNLEARFPSAAPATLEPPPPPPPKVPAVRGRLQALVDASCAQVVVQPVFTEPVRVALAEPMVRPAQPSLADYMEQRTAPRPQVNETPQPLPSPAVAKAPITTAPQANDADAPAWKLNSPKATATALEQTIQRLLADPRYADAYGELIDRLAQDVVQRHVSNFALAAIEPWCGQAELALGIAGMLAERGGDILLIDGGAPGASLSFELGHSQSAGLSQWLAAPSSWSKWIQPTSLRNLYFLPSGTGEVQTDADWPQALQSLRSTFRQVVINTIESSPTRLEVLARAATATYLTVPLGLAETLPAQKTLTRLRTLGARVLGCIAAQPAGS